MNSQAKASEALVYLDSRFSRLQPGDGFLIADEMLLEAFVSLESAAAYFQARGGDMRQHLDGVHLLRKKPDAGVL